MAQQTIFLKVTRPSRILDIIATTGDMLFVLILFLSLTTHLLVFAKPPSARVEDVGIMVPPAISFRSRQVLAIKNRPLALHCPIIISREARVLDLWWTKNGVKLDLNSRIHSTEGDVQIPSRVYLSNAGDLNFEKIVHKIGATRSFSESRIGKNYTDEGEYRCIVKSAVGVVFSPIITVFVAALDGQSGDHEIKVKPGQPALIECQIASTPPLTSAHVTWTRGHINVSRLAQEPNRFSILSTGTLAIFGVQHADTGTYRCFARHELLNVIKSANTKLVVETSNQLTSQEPPKFMFTSDYEIQKSIILDENTEHILECVTFGIPAPTVTWLLTYDIIHKNGTTSPFSKVLSAGNKFYDNILLSPKDSSPDLAKYTCIASSTIIGVGSSISKTIPVLRLPALLKSPNSYKYPPAKTVRFECRVPPTYNLKWYKDGQRLETGKGRVKAKGNKIVISNTIKNDSGFYQCEIYANKYMYAVGTARLLVESNGKAPKAPFDLQCVQSFPKAIIISWRVVAKENVTAFSVHYMQIGGEERQKVTPKSSDFTIENLKPHTNYTIYIRSYSIKHASVQSQKVLCTTLEDVPLKAPRSFVIEKYGPPTQVRIRWRPLPDSDVQGKIVFYKLQWRRIDGEFNSVRYIDGNSEEFLITELDPNETFELRLLSSTSVGWQDDSEQSPWTPFNSTKPGSNVIVTYPEGYFASPIMDLTVLNSTSIFVNWSEPPRTQSMTLKGYRLTYSTEDRRVGDFIFFRPINVYDYTDRSYLFTNFAPATTYEVHLQAFNDKWESEVTSRFIRTFSASGVDSVNSSNILPAISVLQVIPLSSSEVRLNWEKPKSLNSQTHYYYTVRYNKVNGSYIHQYISSESVEIKELKPYTSYQFSVQVMDNSGEAAGPFPQKVESRTLAGIPGVPIQLHWRALNQTLVEIEWMPPLTSNGVIQKYWVEYKHTKKTLRSQGKDNDNTTIDSSWKSKSTRNTSLLLENLLPNKDYVVRVIAEAKAGVGSPSELISVRIFIRKSTSPESLPSSDGTSLEEKHAHNSGDSSHHLVGIIIGVSLSLLFIIVCAIIILNRHRLFPMLSRQPVGDRVNGNVIPPRAQSCVESFTGTVEINECTGGHPQQNGIIPGPTNPVPNCAQEYSFKMEGFFVTPTSNESHNNITIKPTIHGIID